MSETEVENSRSALKASFDNSRSILKYLIPFAGFTVGVYYYFTHNTVQEPHSAPLKSPNLVSPAGGGKHFPKLDELAHKQDQEAANQARKTGNSYTASLSGKDMASSGPIVHELGDVPSAPATKPQNPPPTSPSTKHQPDNRPLDNRAHAEDPFSQQPDPPKDTHRVRKISAQSGSSLNEHAEAELFQLWAGHGATLEMSALHASTNHEQTEYSPRASTSQNARTTAESKDLDKATNTFTRGCFLLAAGRGVYGHSVITSNSDLGKEVLVEIDTGPFKKARISGSFTMQNDRLIIKFSKLMIGDSDPVAVSAYAVSPETAETGVASEVQEHMLTRIVLPSAAAFVQGLGNAMMSANTSSYSGGYGMTSFTHLNIAQQMGAAAGTMGQEVGQLIQKQTPQQATVKLNRNDTVGVLFDEPVYSNL